MTTEDQIVGMPRGPVCDGVPTVEGWYWAQHHVGSQVWWPTWVRGIALYAGGPRRLRASYGGDGNWKELSSVIRWGPRIEEPSE
jgi:hypothetical protein